MPVASSGAGGACGTPLFVMKAKLAGSRPTVSRQSALLTVPVFWSWLRLKIAIAAHHCFGVAADRLQARRPARRVELELEEGRPGCFPM